MFRRDALSSVASNEPYFLLALNSQLYIKRSIQLTHSLSACTLFNLSATDKLKKSEQRYII
uniref:Uncharacterized protein n=1 Tax=Glossina palpalis gambiensis TaxID=67801 RepID=A0A1B0BUQ3_9MUSC